MGGGGGHATARTPEWRVSEPSADVWRSVANALDLHPLAAQILAQRGISSPTEAEAFLEPRLRKHMPAPHGLAGLDEAVERIVTALRDDESIAIHGDYDVDGLTGTALLVEILRSLGADPDYVIPHRIDDGYGLSESGVDELVSGGADLLITVDCGVTATDEIEKARSAGLDVIVIDHHRIDGQLPRATAVVNPQREDGSYPFDDLAAVGVAFNLAVGLRAATRKCEWLNLPDSFNLKGLLDLVALGTVGDVVPLRGANRLFVKRGLELIRRQERLGIAAIIEQASDWEQFIDASTIGYMIAPRLNAAGRISDAQQCVELLTTADRRRAEIIASELEDLNDRRQEIQGDILEVAESHARDQVASGDSILVVSHSGWHRGVLGVVAGRLCDRWNRPAIVLSLEDNVARGSARSIAGIDIAELLSSARHHLREFGGHSEAAGIELAAEDIEPFRQELQTLLDQSIGSLPTPTLDIDGTVQLSELTTTFGRDLTRVGPFGAGVPEPMFVAERLRATDSRIVGDNHLQVTFDDGTNTVRAIGFSMGDQQPLLDSRVDAVFAPKFDIFRGQERVEMHLKSLRRATQ